MSIITTFNFSNPSNYTLVDTEVSGGFGRLSLVEKAALSFLEDFDSDTGFTYDNSKTEFVSGLMRQINLQPLDANLYASYDTDENGNWGNGDLTGTLFGDAAVVGGFLETNGAASNNYIEYSAVGNADSTQILTANIKIRPNYSGTPSTTQLFLTIGENTLNNRIALYHRSDGVGLNLSIRDSSGATIVDFIPIAGWSPVAGIVYELELNMDITTGATRVFLDGVQQGATQTATGTRNAATIVRIGTDHGLSSPNANFDTNEVIFFSTIQHTSDYSPGVIISSTIYSGDIIDLPNFIDSTVGAIQSIQSFTITEVGIINYIIEGQWWNGSSWVASNGLLAESNSLITVQTNISTLSVLGQTSISVSIITEDGSVQSSVNDLTITYTGQKYGPEGTLTTNNSFTAQDIVDFDAVLIEPASTAHLFIACLNGQDKWHDGANWVDSNGTSLEANSFSQFQTEIVNLLSENSSVKIKVVQTTSDDQVTPEADSITIEYNFGALEPSDPTICNVYGYVKDSENNPIENAVVKVKPFRDDIQYVEAADRIIAGTISRTTDANGFWSMDLIISDDYEPADFKYIMTVTLDGATDPIFLNGEEEITFTVPNQPTLNVTAEVTAV